MMQKKKKKQLAKRLKKFALKKKAFTIALSTCSLAGMAQQDTLLNSIGISYEQTHFSKQFADDWRITSIEYGRKTTAAAFIGKLNYAQRFGQEGVQFEAQAYPKISRRVYAYIGASYSNNKPVFANYTTGATLYVGINNGWEIEGGYRQLNFDESIWVGTGGVSKYVRNWLFNLHSFISIDAPADNQSYFFTAKRFFSDPKEMIWVQAGNGVSPDERRNVQLTTANLTSRRLNAGAKFFIWKNMLAQLTAGYSRDEYKEKTYGNQWNGSAGLSVQF
ncbi:MAG: YaiO family outer membrane beta-barrel protein [Chitinophagaceae bacterium]|nr:MAG: YaiO family outer membrane beta-barrel protein [Chitinophagaceae bacterium]